MMDEAISVFAGACAFLIGVISAATIYLFGQPAGVVAMTLGGALLACYRNVSFTKKQVIFWTVAGAIITSVMLELVQYILNYLNQPKLPMKPIAFIVSFIFLDSETREWAKNLFKGWIERFVK